MAALLLPVSGACAFAQQTEPADPAYQQAPPPPPPDAGTVPGSTVPGYAQQQAAPPPQQEYPAQPQEYPQQPQAYPPQQPGYEQDPNPMPPQADDQAPPPPDYDQHNPAMGGAQPQGLAPQQMQQLVAPIALYPDALVAQVLAAATYPQQVVDADHWLQAQGNAAPDQIAAGANAQPWDPSVKGLTAFPQVLQQMAQNLSWTTELGNAYYNEPQDVMNTVQTLREQAESAGTLRSTPQETVDDDQGAIQVAPANPQVVYVPQYNPWAAYGQPIAPYPGFTGWGGYYGANGMQFGAGVALSAFGGMAWGWPMWGMNWGGESLWYHGGAYWSHSRTVADWGFAHGGPRAWGGRGGYGERGYGERGYGWDRAGYGRPDGYAGSRGGYYGNRGGYGNREFHAYGEGPARLAAEQRAGGFRGADAYRGQYGMPSRQPGSRMPEFNGRNYGNVGGNYRPGMNGRGANAYGRTHGGGAYGRGAGAYGQGGGRTQMARNEGMGWGRSEGMNGYRGAEQGFRQPAQTFRAPSQNYRGFGQANRGENFGRGGYGGQGSRGFSGYSGRMPNSGGSRSFGGGRAERSFGGGGHFGGGNHFGGGGGHYSGGGRSGGGHSGGGRSGGGHSGGHRR
ncbi:MAG TPA: DUF3300 domain-containing protein [Acidobacteriaceae bacterium]|jgi:hypothetical protein|nr:DUF3300 domain-containing protein [Acidobacteriaceae bacterium]